MISSQAILSVRPAGEAVCVIDIQGEVTGYAEPQFNEAFRQVQALPVRGVLLNFEKMDFMNSRGIGLVIGFLVRVTAKGQKMAGVGLSGHFRRVFELTRLQEAIPLYETEAEAIAALSGPR
jgi:anti-sigma B factor antagonist